jgi:hypothetical protein
MEFPALQESITMNFSQEKNQSKKHLLGSETDVMGKTGATSHPSELPLRSQIS